MFLFICTPQNVLHLQNMKNFEIYRIQNERYLAIYIQGNYMPLVIL